MVALRRDRWRIVNSVGSRGATDTAEGKLKSVEQLARAHPRQLLTYLQLTNRQVGLLINFGAPTLREGCVGS